MPAVTAGTSGPLPIALIAAVARNGVIGCENRLPWSLPTDLRHFRALTMGKPVVMGRRTFESIGRPLPGRHLVVLSRDAGFASPGIACVRTLDDALRAAAVLARDHGAAELMVAGGGQVYAALIDRAERLYVTEVDGTPEGDTRFPAVDPTVWRETSRVPVQRSAGDDSDCAFVVFERREGRRQSG